MKSVQLPDDLYVKLTTLARQAEFKGIDDYVVFVLQEVVNAQQQDMSPEQEAKVTERLRNLGYM